MNQTTSHDVENSQRNDQLAQALQSRLEQEETTLHRLHGSLQDIRQALRAGKDDQLVAVLRAQEPIIQLMSSARADRLKFQREMADILGDPAAATTITSLLQWLSPNHRVTLTARVEQLTQQARQVAHLYQENAILIYYSLDFLNRFLDEITGGQVASRYGPAGKYQNLVTGSVLELRG